MEAQPARCQLELEAYRLVRSRDAMTSEAANQKADAVLNSYDINIGVLSRVYCEYTVVYEDVVIEMFLGALNSHSRTA